MVGHMKKGDTVLIHSGTGGVGQAAINICLHAGCTVYTTVGAKEKRDFIKRQYPQVFKEPISLLRREEAKAKKVHEHTYSQYIYLFCG
jgi:NADPH:quinone reductase-like Zn-dependent oxidoreductase